MSSSGQTAPYDPCTESQLKEIAVVNRKPLRLLGALVIAGSLVAAGCGSDEDTADSTTTSVEASANQGADTAASKLRSGLTALLQEHVYLAGITTGEALAGRAIDAPAAALEANTQALQDAVASLYGDAGGQQFGDLWRKHIGFFVDYTKGRAANDQAAMDKAVADLDQYREDFGAFLESATEGALTKDAVADELKPHVATLAAAVDAQAAKSPDAVDKLKAAADHMPMKAEILATAFAKQFPDKLAGDVASPAATLRATLTAALQEHVYLAGITTGTALSGADFTPAANVLEKNTQALQDAVASIYGDAGGQQFGDLWRKHIGFFVDYTKGKAANDQAAMDKAVADLDQYREDFGAFLESATEGGLTKMAVADELKPHVATLAAAVDAQAAKDDTQFEKLRTAAGHMPMTAEILAGAIVSQFPDKFEG
jgi:DNA-binding transcriptional regulator YdaS (Cro superfamily)